MMDDRLRQLERAALAGEAEAQAALDQLRVRLGEDRRYWLSAKSSESDRLHMTLVMLIRGELIATAACPTEAISLVWTPASDPEQFCKGCLQSLVPREDTLEQGSRVWHWQLALSVLAGAPPYPPDAGRQEEVGPALASVLNELEGEPDLAGRLRALI